MEDDLILGGDETTDMDLSEDPRDMVIAVQLKIIDSMYYVNDEVSIKRNIVLSRALDIIKELQKQIFKEIKTTNDNDEQ
jgi:hypothetical protein